VGAASRACAARLPLAAGLGAGCGGSAQPPPEHPPPPPTPAASHARKAPGTAAGSIPGSCHRAAAPVCRRASSGRARPRCPPRVGEGDGGDGEAWRSRPPADALSPFVGVSELEPAAGRDASGPRAHRAPPSLSPAAPPARPASTKDAEPASGSLPATQPTAAAGALMDLPTAGEKLEHCTKARPRPNRRHKQPPSKPNVRGESGWRDEGGGFWGFFIIIFNWVNDRRRYLLQARKMRCTEPQPVYYPRISAAAGEGGAARKDGRGGTRENPPSPFLLPAGSC